MRQTARRTRAGAARTIGVRTTVLGLLSWVIPFVVSFAFFGPGGTLMIPLVLFKSLMVVVFGALGAVLLILAFAKIRPTLRSGLAIGFYWFAINVVLDLVILVPMSGMGMGEWVADIGLRYLMIPTMAAAIGFVAERQA